MEITEVRVKLMEESDDRLQAFCSITFDNAFVVRDLKIIDGSNGPFVAMPSRKLTAHCPNCRAKNHLRAAFCNYCGKRLREERLPRDADGRAKLYADVAHPINPQCREMIQNRVIAEYEAELERSAEPGYVSRYDEEYDLDVGPETDDLVADSRAVRPPAATPARPPAAEEPDFPPRQRTHAPQPGAIEPRPPHQPRSGQPAQRPPAKDGGSTFGAGVFD